MIFFKHGKYFSNLLNLNLLISWKIYLQGKNPAWFKMQIINSQSQTRDLLEHIFNKYSLQ